MINQRVSLFNRKRFRNFINLHCRTKGELINIQIPEMLYLPTGLSTSAFPIFVFSHLPLFALSHLPHFLTSALHLFALRRPSSFIPSSLGFPSSILPRPSPERSAPPSAKGLVPRPSSHLPHFLTSALRNFRSSSFRPSPLVQAQRSSIFRSSALPLFALPTFGSSSSAIY